MPAAKFCFLLGMTARHLSRHERSNGSHGRRNTSVNLACWDRLSKLAVHPIDVAGKRLDSAIFEDVLFEALLEKMEFLRAGKFVGNIAHIVYHLGRWALAQPIVGKVANVVDGNIARHSLRQPILKLFA